MGYGVAAHSLIYGAQEFSWHMLRETINLAFWQVFGDLGVSATFECTRRRLFSLWKNFVFSI